MLMPIPRKNIVRPCPCYNHLLTQWLLWKHIKAIRAGAKAKTQAQAQAPPPPKQHHIANFQADASSSSSGHPQLHAPSFDFDPPADLGLLQSPEDACTVLSHRFINKVLLDLHAQTHQITDETDDKSSEDTLEGDTDSVNPGIDNFQNGEDVDTEGEVDLCEGIVSNWDMLDKEFIAEAEGLGKFEHSLLRTDSPVFLCSGEFSILGHDLDILHLFMMKMRNNLTTLAFDGMVYNFSKAGMLNFAKMQSHIWYLSHFKPIEFACCINSCICYACLYAKT